MKVILFLFIFVKKEDMIVFVIILGVVGCFIGGLFLGHLYSVSKTKKEIKDWQVGDVISVYFHGEEQLKKLLGWTLDNVYVENEDSTYKLEISKVVFNKSAIWRRNYDECKSVMKTEPGFKPGLGPKSSKSTLCDGKVIELMSEIECQVYLKQAIESEDFETASKIREQMKKFR